MKIVVLDRSSVGEDVSVEAIKQFGEVDFYNSTPDELVGNGSRTQISLWQTKVR